VDLERFLDAQTSTYDRAVAELTAGRKTSHWMWWVFPQITGLGNSPTSVRYAIADLDEARAYLAHPVLGARLHRCADVLLGLPGEDPEAVVGGIDAVKLRSSMTLFALADPADATFPAVLAKFFDAEPDPLTRAIARP